MGKSSRVVSFGDDSSEGVNPLIENDRLNVNVWPVARRGKSGVGVFVRGLVADCVLDGCHEAFLVWFADEAGFATIDSHGDALAAYSVGLVLVCVWESCDKSYYIGCFVKSVVGCR